MTWAGAEPPLATPSWNRSRAGEPLSRMLPPLALTVMVPPRLDPTVIAPRFALPVPPAGVLTVIDRAFALMFVVVMLKDCGLKPSLPSPSVLAAIEIVPLPALTFVPRTTASPLESAMLPPDVTSPPSVSVPVTLVKLTAPWATTLKVAPFVESRLTSPAELALAVVAVAVTGAAWVPMPAATRLSVGAANVPAVVAVMLPGMFVVMAAAETVPCRTRLGRSVKAIVPVVVTGPAIVRLPVPLIETFSEPAISDAIESLPSPRLNARPATREVASLATPPLTTQPALTAAGVKVIGTLPSAIETLPPEFVMLMLSLEPGGASKTVVPPTTSRVADDPVTPVLTSVSTTLLPTTATPKTSSGLLTAAIVEPLTNDPVGAEAALTMV